MSSLSRVFLHLITSTVFIAANAQPVKQRVIKAPEALNWKAIDKKIPVDVVTSFIKSQPNNFAAYRHPEVYTTTINDLYAKLHFIDINNDGLNDVIFEGRDTGEGGIVEIFINTGKQYKQVFAARQGIKMIEWEKNKIKNLGIDDWGCCAAYVNFEKRYAVSFDGHNLPAFKQVYQAAYMFDGYVPDSLFETPFSFTVLNKNCALRTRPAMDDTSFGPWQENDTLRGMGNVIGILPAAATCTAIGIYTDNTGSEWWYIEIDEKYPLQKNAFYENENKFSAKKRGWVPGNLVKAG